MLLPESVIVTENVEAGAIAQVVKVEQIPIGSMIVDIGPLTISEYTKKLKKCRTVAWNRPMGAFEMPQF